MLVTAIVVENRLIFIPRYHPLYLTPLPSGFIDGRCHPQGKLNETALRHAVRNLTLRRLISVGQIAIRSIFRLPLEGSRFRQRACHGSGSLVQMHQCRTAIFDADNGLDGAPACCCKFDSLQRRARTWLWQFMII
jgi:hypothetical protein